MAICYPYDPSLENIAWILFNPELLGVGELSGVNLEEYKFPPCSLLEKVCQFENYSSPPIGVLRVDFD